MNKMSKQDIITDMDIEILRYDFFIAEIRHIKISYIITFAIHLLILFLVSLYNKDLVKNIVFLYSIFILHITMYKGYRQDIEDIIDKSKNNEEALEKLKELKIAKGIDKRSR